MAARRHASGGATDTLQCRRSRAQGPAQAPRDLKKDNTRDAPGGLLRCVAMRNGAINDIYRSRACSPQRRRSQGVASPVYAHARWLLRAAAADAGRGMVMGNGSIL